MGTFYDLYRQAESVGGAGFSAREMIRLRQLAEQEMRNESKQLRIPPKYRPDEYLSFTYP